MVYESIGRSPVSWAGKPARAVRAIADEPGSILVVPVGSIEQHGHHLPTVTDTLLADAMATIGAEAVADEVPILVAPPLYPGYSPHHLPFGGTLTLEFEHLLRMITDTVSSALRHDFDAVLLVNGHGGNVPVIGAATGVLGVDHPDTTVFGVTYFHLASTFIDEIRDSEVGGMGHAGEFETSLLLHLRPDLVDRNAIEGTPLDDPNPYTLEGMFETGTLDVYRPFSAYSESGAIGEPDLASADKGEAIRDGLEAELAAVLLEIHEEVS